MCICRSIGQWVKTWYSMLIRKKKHSDPEPARSLWGKSKRKELTCQCKKMVWRESYLASCHLHRVSEDNLFVPSQIFLSGASGWCQIPYINQHSWHQERSIMRFQNTPKWLSTFGWLFLLYLYRNTAESTSYHPAFLAWLFISSATTIQTSWLNGSQCLSEAITNKKFQSVTRTFSGTLK